MPRKFVDVEKFLTHLFIPVADPRGIDGGEPAVRLEHTPEQRLLFAMLVDALTLARRRKGLTWFTGGDEREFGSFPFICTVFHLPEGRLRAAVLDGVVATKVFRHPRVPKRSSTTRMRRRRRRPHQEAA